MSLLYSQKLRNDLIYHGAVVVSAIMLTSTVLRIFTGFAVSTDVDDGTLEPRQVSAVPVNLNDVMGLFGTVSTPPSAARIPANVLEPVKLVGVLWTGSSVGSWVVLVHRGQMALRQIDDGLDDGSLVTEIGEDYVVLARGPRLTRVSFDRQLDLHANPWADARFRLASGEGGASGGREHAFVGIETADEDIPATPQLLRASYEAPQPPAALEVRRRQLDQRDPQSDARLQTLFESSSIR